MKFVVSVLFISLSVVMSSHAYTAFLDLGGTAAPAERFLFVPYSTTIVKVESDGTPVVLRQWVILPPQRTKIWFSVIGDTSSRVLLFVFPEPPNNWFYVPLDLKPIDVAMAAPPAVPTHPFTSWGNIKKTRR